MRAASRNSQVPRLASTRLCGHLGSRGGRRSAQFADAAEGVYQFAAYCALRIANCYFSATHVCRAYPITWPRSSATAVPA